MRKILTLIASILIAGVSLCARTVNSVTISNGGPGPYKAEVVEDDGLQGFSIIRPKDLSAAASVEGKLPVIVWGNGACARDSWSFLPYLTNIASHGYVIITNGKWTSEGPDMEKLRAQYEAAMKAQQSQSQTQQNAVHSPTGGDSKKADALELVKTLDWLSAEAKNPKSEYYNAVDTDKVCASGQSCGGLQALVMSTIGDSRFKTTLLNNSGVFNDQEGEKEYLLPKDDLKKLAHPILYVIGGTTDIAYPNAIDDFKRIDNVPVTMANLPVGHGGTFGQENGGQFATLGLLWLDYQLKGKTENEKIFRYCQVPEGLDFTISSKNYQKDIVIDLPAPSSDKEETKVYNDLGFVATYASVVSPDMHVRLPDPDKATGAAVLLCAGGAMIFHSWENDFNQMANYLNSLGIAAIGVKYRTKSMNMPFFAANPAPSGELPAAKKKDAKSSTEAMPQMNMQLHADITQFGLIQKANANPNPGTDEKEINEAADDLNNAIRITKQNAKEWNIDPSKITVMGFSAGGGVCLAAMTRADAETMPAGIATIYGPSLVDIVVPENAPKLYIAVHADHANVAAGCLALFLEWKKAGVQAEMHIHEEKTGGFNTGAGINDNYGTWKTTYYNWLVANGFAK